MKLNRLTPAQNFEIKSRRYHDNTVLLADYKIGTHNIVTFTEDTTLKGQQYYVSGETARKYPLSNNGKLNVRQIPLDEFQVFEGRNE